MKKLMIIALIIVAVMGSTKVLLAAGNEDVTGSWKYEVPTAPHGYEKGTLVFTEKEGKLFGEVIFADGYKIDMKNLTFENGELKGGLYVDYEYVSINAKIEGNKMTGVANTPEGEMKLTAEKQK